MTGISRPEAAQRLVDALAKPRHDELIAKALASIRAWAIEAGWLEEELMAVMPSMAENIAIAERKSATDQTTWT